jgi:hypothetical protein
MLKKEHIKQAIEAIAARNPEIGYTLDEMLGMDRIRVGPAGPDAEKGEDFHFFFNDRPVRVKKVLFFNQGTVPIEERLLIHFGEMITQHQFAQKGQDLDFRQAAEASREAGLRLVVDHEIDIALQRLEHAVADGTVDPRWAADRAARLEAIKNDRRPLALTPAIRPENGEGKGLYAGSVDDGLQAEFMPFPFCMDALMQAADINLEFFNIRFILSCWTKGLERNLFACVAAGRVEGLVHLVSKKSFFYRALEIHFIATSRGRPAAGDDPGRKELRGVGTFLVAGVWLLWQERLPDHKDLLLDSEVGARHFYESIGFQARGFSAFIMKAPRGRLVPAIVAMAGRCPELQPRTVKAIVKMLHKQLRTLRKTPRSQKDIRVRQYALEALRAALRADSNKTIASAVKENLARCRGKVPEADTLLG